VSENWADRERRTNRLIRLVAAHIFRGAVSPLQIYCLCRLTWITKSYTQEDASYIDSIKMPALGAIFARDYSNKSLKYVAHDVAGILDLPAAENLVLSHTGFTNIYNAYRNSSGDWIEKHFEKLVPMFRSAYALQDDEQGRSLARSIGRLPKISSPNRRQGPMRPEHLITPAFFALDERLRFPIINGRDHVKKLLAKQGMANAELADKYSSLVDLYGHGGIVDAADLDQVRDDLLAFVGSKGKSPGLLQRKSTTGKNLSLKDEADIEVLQRTLTEKRRRIHNHLTNKLRKCLRDYTLLEGEEKAALFDVSIKNYNDKNLDLLIEVKSAADPSNIRMAIGQLYAYWFHIKGDAEPHLAILLPAKPDEAAIQLLEWLDIGILWFSGKSLKTSNEWLAHLTTNKEPTSA
jgi:hypothetical protein